MSIWLWWERPIIFLPTPELPSWVITRESVWKCAVWVKACAHILEYLSWLSCCGATLVWWMNVRAACIWVAIKKITLSAKYGFYHKTCDDYRLATFLDFQELCSARESINTEHYKRMGSLPTWEETVHGNFVVGLHSIYCLFHSVRHFFRDAT